MFNLKILRVVGSKWNPTNHDFDVYFNVQISRNSIERKISCVSKAKLNYDYISGSNTCSGIYKWRTAGKIVIFSTLLLSVLVYNFYTSILVSSLLIDIPSPYTTLSQLASSTLETGLEQKGYVSKLIEVPNNNKKKKNTNNILL